MPQEIKVPLEKWAEDLIDRALEKHAHNCPLAPRVRRLEMRLWTLIGFMVGSGLLGGAVGAGIMRSTGLH